MGLLDDAIREHLELKRRRGADAEEVTRQEQEALGPTQRAEFAAATPAEPAEPAEPVEPEVVAEPLDQPTVEYRHDEPDHAEGEDVLEETPDFLQETPEHDRLWFEQKPPRDFDLDR